MEAINKHRPALQLRPGPRPPVVKRAHSFLYAWPSVPPGLADPHCALLRFRALMRRLDRWLDAPLRTTRDACGYTAWLMGLCGARLRVSAPHNGPGARVSCENSVQ